ncbi:LOW QUALITY PROTEIN: Golgi-associated PDZ and coiled-coil motif-containing protein-like [Rhipicephalus sanguineus]|uniref:LOW QUALITY PROTEIN: Golgi-associated PDZ and coiled-coil motif-containing protein-like n=1 Tax=Rhipicephalus sanguineus TaxID=34632 RepID=UPI0018955185|nr:LOW QUALITY PROTEIN: Golgi-associated PDZ and coiled-coil motif-containing protein-like [Rhipicephalus sanguineus]
MATSAVAMKWLELLEKEFDRAYLDLDILLGEVDEEQCDITYEARRRMSALSSAFAQLCHKAQTVFETNEKLECELQELKSDLYEAQSTSSVLNKELQHLVLQLHSAQLQVSAQMGHAGDSTAIKQKLEQEMTMYRMDLGREMQLEAEVAQLRKENAALRRDIVSLQSEVFGAKLAAKYLDKELAGRIQQIQLLGRDLNPSEHDRLWNQLESEIHLHRHKAVIRACRGRSSNAATLPGPELTMPDEGTPLRRHQGIGDVRTVRLTKGKDEGLGISITGGLEHGVPIVISEVLPDMPAWRSGKLFVGDAILAANGVDLREAKHNDAVKVLSGLQGEITLKVLYVSPDEDSDDETQDSQHLRYHFFYPEDVSETSVAPSDDENGVVDRSLSRFATSPHMTPGHGATTAVPGIAVPATPEARAKSSENVGREATPEVKAVTNASPAKLANEVNGTAGTEQRAVAT